MPFREVDAPNAALYSDPESIYDYLKVELPGRTETYYRDMQERIISLAMARGQNIGTVVESFIIGARLRAVSDCPTCSGTGYVTRYTLGADKPVEIKCPACFFGAKAIAHDTE